MTMSPSKLHRFESSNAQATLLLFTLGAVAETDRRRLLPASCRAEELSFHRACLDNALSAGREADCRLVVSSPAGLDLAPDAQLVEQRGRGFGQRLGRALFDAFEAFDSTGPVVVVGGDSPDLGPEHVASAIEQIEHADVVLGPCHDGGLYLLASRRPLGGLLEAVRWCRPSTLSDLVSRLSGAGLRIAFLAPLGDLDRSSDLDRWLAEGCSREFQIGWCRPIDRSLLRLISRALAAHRRPAETQRTIRPSASHLTSRWGRAPPLAA